MVNYTTSILKCQENNGDLANILSEVRTNVLSKLIKDNLRLWYKAAYVGLDDIKEEGKFETSSGNLMSCYKFRAWAPGHPRTVDKDADCVVLDDNRMWRVINCNETLPFVCELYPESPSMKNKTRSQNDCSLVYDGCKLCLITIYIQFHIEFCKSFFSGIR